MIPVFGLTVLLTVALSSPPSSAECLVYLGATPAVEKRVYNLTANHSPVILQCSQNCYMESVLGAVQDFVLLTQQRQHTRPSDYLVLSRIGPNARMLSLRMGRLLRQKSGDSTAERAANLIDVGTVAVAARILKNIDIPLFRIGFRDPYSGVREMIREMQSRVALSVSSYLSPLEILNPLDRRLSEIVQADFNHDQNADRYYHVDSVDLSGALFNRPLTSLQPETILKDVVNYSIPTLAIYDVGRAVDHVARVAGYTQKDKKKEPDGIIISDTALHLDRNGHVTTQVEMSLDEFRARKGELLPLSIKGRFIPRASAKRIPLFR
ncbi:MAG: hypothetical protein AB7P49_17110 [Bdellovibrionales bacterium]